MCQLPIRGVTAEAVKDAVVQGKTTNGPMSVMMHELKVAYELLLDAKRHKQRIADVVLAAQDCSRTPPAAGSSPRILGLGTSPSAFVRLDFGKADSGMLGPGGRPAAAVDQRDLPARRRR